MCDNLAILCVYYLINFSPVTPEFKRVVGVHPYSLVFKQIKPLRQFLQDLLDRFLQNFHYVVGI